METYEAIEIRFVDAEPVYAIVEVSERGIRRVTLDKVRTFPRPMALVNGAWLPLHQAGEGELRWTLAPSMIEIRL